MLHGPTQVNIEKNEAAWGLCRPERAREDDFYPAGAAEKNVRPEAGHRLPAGAR